MVEFTKTAPVWFYEVLAKIGSKIHVIRTKGAGGRFDGSVS